MSYVGQGDGFCGSFRRGKKRERKKSRERVMDGEKKEKGFNDVTSL